MLSTAGGIDYSNAHRLGDYVSPSWDIETWYNGLDCTFPDDGSDKLVITSFAKMNDDSNPHLITFVFDHQLNTLTQSAEGKFAMNSVFDIDKLEDLYYDGSYHFSFSTGDGFVYRLAKIQNQPHGSYTNL